VIAVENMAMIRMHTEERSRPCQQGAGGQPAVEPARESPHRAGLGGMRVNYRGTKLDEKPIELPECNHVLERNLASEGGEAERLDPLSDGETGHVLFA